VYAGDIHLPNMSYAKLLRSPVAHARIVSLDCSAALARPGVAHSGRHAGGAVDRRRLVRAAGPR
jgi:CO/xanthine dehydrogenase Mo-binding subunit